VEARTSATKSAIVKSFRGRSPEITEFRSEDRAADDFFVEGHKSSMEPPLGEDQHVDEFPLLKTSAALTISSSGAFALHRAQERPSGARWEIAG